MSEAPKKRRLKGSVRIARTIQVRRFEPASLTVSEEFWLDEKTVEQAISELTERVNRWFGKGELV